MSKRKKPKRGDLVLVSWLDIVTDAHDDPTDADAMHFETVAKFWCWKRTKHGRVLVTTDSTALDGSPYGYTAYPEGCIVKVRRV